MESIPNTALEKIKTDIEKGVLNAIAGFDYKSFTKIMKSDLAKSIEITTDISETAIPKVFFDNLIPDLARVETSHDGNVELKLNIKLLLEKCTSIIALLHPEYGTIQNIIEFVINKILYHELTHLYGDFPTNSEIDIYNPLTEAVTEIFTISNLGKYYHQSKFSIYYETLNRGFLRYSLYSYPEERDIFAKLVELIGYHQEVDTTVIANSFKSAYLNKLDVMSDSFKSSLPPELQAIWGKFIGIKERGTSEWESEMVSVSSSLEDLLFIQKGVDKSEEAEVF